MRRTIVLLVVAGLILSGTAVLAENGGDPVTLCADRGGEVKLASAGECKTTCPDGSNGHTNGTSPESCIGHL